MDGISSAAAVLQLLSQAVALLQEVYEVREAIRAAPKLLEETRDHLFAVTSMVKDVAQEPRLRIPPIMAILTRIEGCAQELVLILRSMERLGQRSKLCQSIHLLIKRHRDEARLAGIMGRLELAKSDLGIQIQVAHVGTTTEVATGVQRIEKSIQLAVKKDQSQNAFVMQENQALESSNQVNAIYASQGFGASMTANISKNLASGTAGQRNFIFSGNNSVEKW